MLLFSKKIKTQVSEQEELGTWSLLHSVFLITQESMVATQKVSQGLEEAWNNLYAGYVQGVASTLVFVSSLEDEQRAKRGRVVDSC